MRPLPLIALGAALVAVAGLCSYQLAGSSIGRTGGAPPRDTGPKAIAVPVTAAMVATRDGRYLVYTDPARCTSAWFGVDEGGADIRLTYQVLPDVGACDRGADYPWFSASTQAQVDLGSGLEGRTVVDTTTGRPVPIIPEADVPEPGSTPGWKVDTHSSRVASAVSDFGGPGTATAADWYAAGPDGAGMTGFLLVLVTTGQWNPPAGTAIRPVRVRGVTGRTAAGIVVWSTGQRTYAVRWDPWHQDSSPDTATLVALADNLVPGGGP